MSESKNVWHPLKRALDNRNWAYQRLEDRITPGIPDVNVHVPDLGDVWIELKEIEQKSANSFLVGLEREQFIWLRQGILDGRKCGLLGRLGNDWLLFGGIEALRRAKAPQTKESLYRDCVLFKSADEFLSFAQTNKLNEFGQI